MIYGVVRPIVLRSMMALNMLGGMASEYTLAAGLAYHPAAPGCQTGN